jgi:hypothetical protein
MALFNDGPISEAIQIQDYESSVLTIANLEGIDVGGKAVLAQDDIANQLMIFLLRCLPTQDVQSTLRRTRGVSDVVVTAPLRQWHAHRTLELVYRDAYNNQLNDRYRGKWREYEQLAKTSAQNYYQVGVAMAADPIPKPSVPILSTNPGASSAGSYYVTATWVNQGGEESAPSQAAQITVGQGQGLIVTLAGPPANATGWNTYVGHSPDTVTLQNDEPVPRSTSWVMTTALIQGRVPGDGQLPTWFLADHRVIGRG